MDSLELRQACVNEMKGKDWLTTSEITVLIGAGSANAIDTLSKMKNSPIDKKVKAGKSHWKHNGKEYAPNTYARKTSRQDFSQVTNQAVNALDNIIEENKANRDFLTDIRIRAQGIVNDIKAMGL